METTQLKVTLSGEIRLTLPNQKARNIDWFNESGDHSTANAIQQNIYTAKAKATVSITNCSEMEILNGFLSFFLLMNYWLHHAIIFWKKVRSYILRTKGV
jgi:hypothetical protein